MQYAIHRDFPKDLGFEYIEQVTRDILQEHGFGILTEINVQATLKKKIGVDRSPYKILGACNPPRANRALNGEADIGLLLPCNVVIYETKEGKIRVAATKATTIFTVVDNPQVKPVTEEVDEIMEKVIEKVHKKLLN